MSTKETDARSRRNGVEVFVVQLVPLINVRDVQLSVLKHNYRECLQRGMVRHAHMIASELERRHAVWRVDGTSEYRPEGCKSVVISLSDVLHFKVNLTGIRTVYICDGEEPEGPLNPHIYFRNECNLRDLPRLWFDDFPSSVDIIHAHVPLTSLFAYTTSPIIKQIAGLRISADECQYYPFLRRLSGAFTNVHTLYIQNVSGPMTLTEDAIQTIDAALTACPALNTISIIYAGRACSLTEAVHKVYMMLLQRGFTGRLEYVFKRGYYVVERDVDTLDVCIHSVMIEVVQCDGGRLERRKTVHTYQQCRPQHDLRCVHVVPFQERKHNHLHVGSPLIYVMDLG